MVSKHHTSRIVLPLLVAVLSTPHAAAVVPSYTIAGVYETKSEIARSVSKIDLDQYELQEFLRLDGDNQDADWLSKAKAVYENGMHSGPYAKLTVALEHDVDLPVPEEGFYKNDISFDNKKQNVYKLNVFGGDFGFQNPVHGIIATADPGRCFPIGTSTTVYVYYPEDSKCNVDGNMDGCFAGPTGGLVLQGYGALDYTYDPHKDNKFQASLKQFSEEEGMRMLYCEQHGGCAFPEYQHFYNYYGILDYGHHWINAAFSQTSTVYSTKVKLKHGNEDFSLLSKAVRNTAIETATVAMNVFTAVNRLMVEKGIDACKKNSRDFSSYGNNLGMTSVIGDWDTAVATYAGSKLVAPTTTTATKSSEETGSLYYNMVETLAREFGVLEDSSSGPRSIVNRKILEEFQAGRDGLQHGECEGPTRTSYQKIVSMMRVPWIQGVLRASYRLSRGIDDDGVPLDRERGRGAAFLAALLPDLYECSKDAADVIYHELKINTSSDLLSTPDYDKVRTTLEEQYECLAVTCDDIGGYLNRNTGKFFKDTRPCGGYGASRTQRRNSVTYDSKAVAHGKKRSTAGGFGTSSSTLLVAAVAFCASVATLLVTMNEHARRTGGQRVTIGSLASAVSSRADYWMSSCNNPHNNAYRGYDYNPTATSMPEFQLHTMTSSPSSAAGDNLL